MKALGFATILLLLAVETVSAQKSFIGGVVNQYTPVRDIDYCTNTIEVDNVFPFQVGDRVLLIQMKGAEVNTNDNNNYGQVIDLRGAGNYEFHDIKSITNRFITFESAMLKLFEVSGRVQLIHVPQYQTAEVTSPITALSWNGAMGGVLVLEADSLILNDSIDLYGKGFRGGLERNIPFCFAGGIGGYQGFRCDTGSNCGGFKGEGIFEEGRVLGRGPFVNGGGGGNDHNTGGGGGANIAGGGLGGERLNVQAISCPGPGPGRGGLALDYNNDSARTYLGGGGGAGDMNNNVGTAGGDGGGMLILNVNVLQSNNQVINANGVSVSTVAGGDGAGGGGAAGTVMIQANQINGDLEVKLNGGGGGDVASGTSTTFCFGPGGGGSGGALWLSSPSLPANINTSFLGGRSGEQVFNNPPANCPVGSTNGATGGQNGSAVFNLALSYPADSFIELQSSACCDDTICLGDSSRLTVQGISTFGPTFEWLSGSTDSVEVVRPTSTRVFSVTAFDHSGCRETHILEITVNAPVVTAQADPDSAVIVGNPVQLSVDSIIPGASYRWAPASTLNDSTIPNPIATPFVTTEYCVTVTDVNGCQNTDCVTVTTETPLISMPNAFSPNGDGLNDLFRVVLGGNLSVEEMVIYSRWGDLVYQGSGNTGWDGRFKGVNQPSGTYVYYVHVINPEDESQVILETGSFSLVR